MTKQIAVRMSDEAAKVIDETVAQGRFSSRAAYLSWLVERDALRRRDLADLDRLRAAGVLHDPEVRDIVRATARRSLADLDS